MTEYGQALRLIQGDLTTAELVLEARRPVRAEFAPTADELNSVEAVRL
jgi:hypothetical protein